MVHKALKRTVDHTLNLLPVILRGEHCVCNSGHDRPIKIWKVRRSRLTVVRRPRI